ncbi:putative adhesin [Acidocella facilis]|uniref:putative adhesin n=1 Tax=Acidocella facilis TaxID=525 RepID=UPI001F46F560|nr:SGNH/GDSL hydrolase family protein [Acidocella facilis]
MKPHMDFSKSRFAAQPIVTPDAYMLSGNPKNSVCYIGAHGAALDNKSFRIPDGITVMFTQPHGYTMSMEMSFLRHNQPVVDRSGWGRTTYYAGNQCPNYSLMKWHGRHSGYASKADWENAGEDYRGWQHLVFLNNDLTLAFPRNRWYKQGLTLEQMIKIIRKKLPKITTIWCLFCRYDGSSGWSYDAQTGNWTLTETVNNVTKNYVWDYAQNRQVEVV